MSNFYHDRFFSLADQNIQQPEQRSPEWFEARKGKITGSKLSPLLFCDNPDDRIRIYEELFEGRRKAPFPETAKKFMLWGQEHEDIAMESLLNHMPNIVAMEAPMMHHTECNYLAASPDGFYEETDTGENGIVEIKCPGKRKKANVKVTYYYVPQMYLEMACSGKTSAMFVSWGLDCTRAWKLRWRDEMWQALCYMIDVFRRTKKDATWEDFVMAKYKLKKQCQLCVEEAEILCSSKGWSTEK